MVRCFNKNIPGQQRKMGNARGTSVYPAKKSSALPMPEPRAPKEFLPGGDFPLLCSFLLLCFIKRDSEALL